MRLRALTGLERDKLENEYKELQEKIAAKGAAGAFSEVSGITDPELLKQVEAAYEQVAELFK